MRQWRATQKGKPKPSRRRRPGRPPLPKSRNAVDPKQWEPLANKLAHGYARQHRWEFHESKLGTDGTYRYDKFMEALVACAEDELAKICRRTPKLEKPAAYLLKSLQLRCLNRFDQIRLEHLGRSASVPAGRKIREALLARIDRHREGLRQTTGLSAWRHEAEYRAAVEQAEAVGLIDPLRSDRRSTTGHFSDEYDQERQGRSRA